MDHQNISSGWGHREGLTWFVAALLLAGAPWLSIAEDPSVFDKITAFFSERFSSGGSEVPKARSLETCTALSEDAHELMILRQEGKARSAATRRSLEMAARIVWPSAAKADAESAYMQLVSQAYAVDRSWFFFTRDRIADEFRDDTFAECLSDF